jgi:hypothetical protein
MGKHSKNKIKLAKAIKKLQQIKQEEDVKTTTNITGNGRA